MSGTDVLSPDSSTSSEANGQLQTSVPLVDLEDQRSRRFTRSARGRSSSTWIAFSIWRSSTG